MYSNLSFFSQIIHSLDKNLIRGIFSRHASDKGNKGGINSWTHFVSMIFGQLSHSNSLREVCFGMATCVKEIGSLNLKGLPNKSSLSYANRKRQWEPFQEIFFALKEHFFARAGLKHRFRIKSKIFLMDSTLITLCLEIFQWARYTRTKGAIKLHTLLDCDGYLPAFVRVTDGKTSDVKIAWELALPKGSVIVVDRGYNDYELFKKWTREGIRFVIRMKNNARYQITDLYDTNWKYDILSDMDIEIGGMRLRKVTIWLPEKAETMELLTNEKSWTASTIAEMYRERWMIETFFKDLKQNLKIKTFYGTNLNAVMTQIWTALTTHLIVRWLKHIAKFGWSLSNLIAFVRMTLFSKILLQHWLDNPLDPPPEPSKTPEQLNLFPMN